MKENFFTFTFILIVWLLFAGKVTYDRLFMGIFVSLLTTFLFKDMLFRFSLNKFNFIVYLKKGFLILLFIPIFFYEVFISALKVAKHAFEIHPSFSPGIVKVKTHLTNISAITILANLITLTPGTLTLDFDVQERVYYIHWIDVRTEEEAEIRKELIESFEKWLGGIFK